mgnify:CR=1 FL=1
MAKKKTTSTTDAAMRELRAYGLTYPGAYTKSPWPGHLDLVVRDKTFAFLSSDGEPFSISCKLPDSSFAALMLPFTKPTPYGLGKSGWVNAKIGEGEAVPVEMFKAWIDESYRAQAPKTLVKQLDASSPSKASAKPIQAKATQAKPDKSAAAKATKPAKAAKSDAPRPTAGKAKRATATTKAKKSARRS